MSRINIESKLTRFIVSTFNLLLSIVALCYVFLYHGQHASQVLIACLAYYTAFLFYILIKRKNTERDTKSSKVMFKWIRDSILYILMLVFMLVSYHNTLDISEHSISGDVKEAVASTKSKYQFPHQMNESLSLINITSDSKTIKYRVSVIDTLDLDDKLIDDIKNRDIIPNTCENSGIRGLIDRGALVEYIFEQPSTSTSYTISVDRSSCR